LNSARPAWMHDCVVLHASGTVGTDNYHTRFSRKRKSWPATMLSIPEDYVHGGTTDSPPDVLALQQTPHAQSDRYEISVVSHRESASKSVLVPPDSPAKRPGRNDRCLSAGSQALCHSGIGGRGAAKARCTPRGTCTCMASGRTSRRP